MIETDFGRYHLLPVPARLQDNDVDQGHMHVVIPKNETGTFCGVHGKTKSIQLFILMDRISLFELCRAQHAAEAYGRFNATSSWCSSPSRGFSDGKAVHRNSGICRFHAVQIARWKIIAGGPRCVR